MTLTEGTVIYTEKYCSPEQRNDFHSAQPPADVYSFGCILHDIFGTSPRTPYSQHTAAGPLGIIIEKCTELNPSRRPSIPVLRKLVLETLVEIGGHCKVKDAQSEEWLRSLEQLDTWTPEKFDEFVRFFAQLDHNERTTGHENAWADTASTPFLTRLPLDAIIMIVKRCDGAAAAIVEKYCNWVRATSFAFHFSDTVCSRLTSIFDNGTPANKAMAFVALIQLAESHNRWYVMRQMLACGAKDKNPKEIARRLAIEIKTEEVQHQFQRCVSELKWSPDLLASDLAKLCG